MRTSKSLFTLPVENVHCLDASEMLEDNTIVNGTFNNNYRNHTNTHPGDVSIMSTENDKPIAHNNYLWKQMFMPNQFQIKIQPESITIQTTIMIKDAENWHVEWNEPKMNPKDMYEDIRAQVEYFTLLYKKSTPQS